MPLVASAKPTGRSESMAKSEITFSPERALETILYLAARLEEPTVHEVLKLRYFADKLHLGQFGWLASGDDYVAMKFGPVGSGTYNLLRAARGDQSGWIHPRFSELVHDALAVGADKKTVLGQRPSDPSRLSGAEIECLDEALRLYGGMGFRQRTMLSHDDAWLAAWKAAAEDEVGQSPMAVEAIAGTLPNADELIAHIRH